jgi:hypothetical protein
MSVDVFLGTVRRRYMNDTASTAMVVRQPESRDHQVSALTDLY